MAALKYSRQRESIKHYLMTTKEHPTADTVYMHVKKEFPNISLGTVYRNLNLLTDIGEAIKISTPDGGDRFDGRIEPHNHFLCEECGRLLDLDLDMRKAHLERVSRGNCDASLTAPFNSILHNIDRMSNSCVNIAEAALGQVDFNYFINIKVFREEIKEKMQQLV